MLAYSKGLPTYLCNTNQEYETKDQSKTIYHAKHNKRIKATTYFFGLSKTCLNIDLALSTIPH